MLFDDYLNDLPMLHSWDGGRAWHTGGFTPKHLKPSYNYLKRNLPPHPVFLETGAGNSTIMLLFLELRKLISIAPNHNLFDRIFDFCRKNGIRDTALEPHIDGSQWVMR